MSDVMYPLPFAKMIEQILGEYKSYGRIFDVERIYKSEKDQNLVFAGEELENPLGLAAGPHTQLAQNLVASYAGGGRFLETKTVQSKYGEDLGIPRPCMRADDEAYNVEWSSEFPPRLAAEEYIKAFIACYVIAIEFGLGDPNKFQFNMSVGYNLAGVKEKSVDDFLNLLTDAKDDAFYKECKKWLVDNIEKFDVLTLEDIENIPSKICNTTTLSTMHGCPADEIEEIMKHLQDKGLNSMLKLNPTLLGYDYVRSTLDDLGYGYIGLNKESFQTDLQAEDAIPLLKRLMASAKDKGVFFGVKLSNTLEVINDGITLPGGDSMYMSGKALYPLTISLAAKLAEEFNGDLAASYCGGANRGNIVDIYKTGMFPITVCTDIMVGQGYNKLSPMADLLVAEESLEIGNLDIKKLEDLKADIVKNKANHKTDAAKRKQDNLKDYKVVRQENTIECRILCKSCVRVCPNRANTTVELENGPSIILHLDLACNECGNCQFPCVEPCAPYLDRITLFECKDHFINSTNNGFYKVDDKYGARFASQTYEGKLDQMPAEIKKVIEAVEGQQPWLI